MLHFFAKGMWRKGLSPLAVVIAIGVVLTISDVPYSVARAISTGFAAANMTVANYAYYLHVIRHSRSWNFLEGFRSRAQYV
jgi:Protein of unknown function (DUF2628)